jgi:hypothetical protein
MCVRASEADKESYHIGYIITAMRNTHANRTQHQQRYEILLSCQILYVSLIMDRESSIEEGREGDGGEGIMCYALVRPIVTLSNSGKFSNIASWMFMSFSSKESTDSSSAEFRNAFWVRLGLRSACSITNSR